MAEMNEVQKRILALQRKRQAERLDAPLSPKLMADLTAQMIVGLHRYSAARIWAIMNGGPDEFKLSENVRDD